MTKDELAAAWQDLADWWARHKAFYNAPGVAARAGLHKGRFYALLVPGSQGGSTARRTEAAYLQISDALSFRYYRPSQKNGTKPTPVELRADYAANGLNTLAVWYDVPAKTVREWLVEYGIPLRGVGEKIVKPLPIPDSDVPRS